MIRLRLRLLVLGEEELIPTYSYTTIGPSGTEVADKSDPSSYEICSTVLIQNLGNSESQHTAGLQQRELALARLWGGLGALRTYSQRAQSGLIYEGINNQENVICRDP